MAIPPPPGRGGMTSHDVFLGVFWSVLAAIFHSFVPIAVRLLSGHMPSIEIVFFRNAIGLVFFLALFSWRGFGFVKTRNFGLHLQRNLVNFSGMWLWFAALGLMPMAKAIALHFTVPIWATILAIVILTERPGPRRLIATAIGFGGVLIILRPGMIPVGFAALMVLGSAILYAGVGIYSRVLGRTDDPATTTFYYQLMLSVFALGPALFVWVAPVWDDLPALLAVAAAGTIAPYCQIRAFKYAEASVVSPIDFLRLPVTASFAWVVFGESTEVWTWIGAAVIFGSTYYMTLVASRAARG